MLSWLSETATFVFRDHLRLAVHAALLFAVGLFASWPVVRYRLMLLAWPPLMVFRLVLLLLGRRPSIARTAVVICAFNSSVMFLYMASGFHAALPRLFAAWTGMNVGIIMGMGQEAGPLTVEAPPGGWMPSRRLSLAGGVAVLVLELPTFWFSLAMGISMGHAVQSAVQPYWGALAERAAAYGALLAPVLLVSALAESVAIRGSQGLAGPARAGPSP